ncbi:MAG: hypothetical protein EOO73_12570 [Myxococcales bacterium]|nr:MAG: hypothetical protein EOO73_12570 [Myxococcales bacterium]
MPTRVFSQEPDLVAALPRLLQHARRFFAADLNVLGSSPPDRASPQEGYVGLRWESARYPGQGTFRVTSRAANDDDRFAAEAAEARGRAGGMSELAARCACVWTITTEGEATGTAELQLSALLASVALGPVLPEDGSTLYGVRGAMERAEKAAQS